MNSTSITPSDLRVPLPKRVVAPDDPVYETTRAVFYGGIDRRPALIHPSGSRAGARHRCARQPEIE